MNLRVLIADDEPLIRDGLAHAINWSALGFEVCGLAGNGQEAYDLASSSRPDLMLVDIWMPLLNGLQLIEKVRTVLPDVVFIIISGHDEFEFARQAINLGVKDYLLKPVSETQLRASVTQIFHEISRKREAQDRLNFSLSMLEKNMSILREQFYQQLITGQLVQEEIDEQLKFHGLSREYSHFCLLRVIGQNSTVQFVGESDRHLLRFAMQNIFTEQLETCGSYICSADLNTNLFALVNVIDYQRWHDLSSQICRFMLQIFKIEVRLDQCYFGSDWTLIAEYYNDWMADNVRQMSRLTERAIQYIDLHSGDPELTFRRLCEAMYVSSSHLSKIFKQDTGQTFVDYLTKVRIQKSLLLIQDPDRRVYEIAGDVGFRTQHYFSAAFKKILGVTPSEYKLKNLGRVECTSQERL